MHPHGMCLRNSLKIPPLRSLIPAALHLGFISFLPATAYRWAESEGVAELSTRRLLGRGSDSESTRAEKKVTPLLANAKSMA